MNEKAKSTDPGAQYDPRAHAIVYQVAVGLWDREADRFWARSNVFLVINGAFLTVVTSLSASPRITLILSALGVYFTILWMFVNKKGSYYIARWRPSIERIEKELGERLGVECLPLTLVPGRRPIPDEKRPPWWSLVVGSTIPRGSSTEFMRWAILGFLATWIVLFCLNVILLASPRSRGAEQVTARVTASGESGPATGASAFGDTSRPGEGGMIDSVGAKRE